MTFESTAFDLSSAHMVLELHEASTPSALPLELHVAHIDEIGTIAWWCTEWGEVLALVEVGRG